MSADIGPDIGFSVSHRLACRFHVGRHRTRHLGGDFHIGWHVGSRSADIGPDISHIGPDIGLCKADVGPDISHIGPDIGFCKTDVGPDISHIGPDMGFCKADVGPDMAQYLQGFPWDSLGFPRIPLGSP